VLHAGRLPCSPRHGRSDCHGYRPRADGEASGGPQERRGIGLLVLAFRGRRVGGGLHGGLPGREVEMANEVEAMPPSEPRPEPDTVEMPRPTVAPLVLSLGVAMFAAGAALGLAFLVVGALVAVAGLGIWVAALLPGQGHFHQPRVEPARRPGPVTSEHP